MKNKNKGFTLIELLAVIVILGLLMAIAIPSVTRYITQSRKKTAVSTMGNYMSAVVNEVNDLEYTFTGSNTIYAVPIECVSVERGGKSPFGEWMQANDAYWAYVLIQYDELSSSYTYGFTFKDSAGYGMYPMSEAKIDTKGSQIQTGLNLTRPKNGKATSFIESSKWAGFSVDGNTELVVLEATSENETGDGKNTCTLRQKGNNYDGIEQEKEEKNKILANLIKKHNTLITSIPTLTNASKYTSDVSGLYSSNATNDGSITYYFRGNVTNNYVKFANHTWRIMRVNEDGTVRLVSNIGISGDEFHSSYANVTDFYYSSSDTAKLKVDNWYKTNIVDKGFDSYIDTSVFCEQAKVKYADFETSGSATMIVYTSYTPTFKCSTDGNGKGIITDKVGMITYDEVVFAGGYYNVENDGETYLDNNFGYWTMTPSGFRASSMGARLWTVTADAKISHYPTDGLFKYRPVITLKSDVTAIGTGTSTDPYVVQTN